MAVNAIVVAQNVLDTATMQSAIDGAVETLLAEMALFIPNATGILNTNFANIGIYPNPATDALFISINDQFRIKITDAGGRVLVNTKVENKRVDVSSLENGLYFIQFMIKDKFLGTKKFIKLKN